MTTAKFWNNRKLILKFTIPASELAVAPNVGYYYLIGKKAFKIQEVVLNHTVIKDFVDHQMNVYLEKVELNKLLKHSHKVFQKEYEANLKKAKKADRLDYKGR